MARIISEAAVSTSRMEKDRKNKFFILSVFVTIIFFFLVFFIYKFNFWAIGFFSLLLVISLYNLVLLLRRVNDAHIGSRAEKYFSNYVDKFLPSSYWVINDLKIKYGNIDCLIIDTVKNCVFLIEIKSSRRFDRGKVAKWLKQCELSRDVLGKLIKSFWQIDIPIFTIICLPFANENLEFLFENSNIRLMGIKKIVEFIKNVPKNDLKVNWFEFVENITKCKYVCY